MYQEPNLTDKAEDSSKNEKHGDGGRAEGKVEKQIAELEAQLATATGKEVKRIKQKIQNIKKMLLKKEKEKNILEAKNNDKLFNTI